MPMSSTPATMNQIVTISGSAHEEVPCVGSSYAAPTDGVLPGTPRTSTSGFGPGVSRRRMAATRPGALSWIGFVHRSCRVPPMQALSVIPGTANSTRLVSVAEPPESDGAVIAETLAIGVCGTDTEIAAGAYGWPPPGRERLIIGHESIARVLEAPPDCGLH